MDVDLEFDFEPLVRVLKKLPDETKGKVVRQATAAGARVIRDEAKDLAPFDPNRKTGTHLRDGITVKRLQGTNDIMRIGTVARKVPHAHLLEFGHRNVDGGFTPPQPFMRPAADAKLSEASVKILDRLAKGIIREAKKLAGK